MNDSAVRAPGTVLLQAEHVFVRPGDADLFAATGGGSACFLGTVGMACSSRPVNKNREGKNKKCSVGESMQICADHAQTISKLQAVLSCS